MSQVVRAIRAFGHFWREFLVGDSPELAVASAAVVVLAFAVAHDHAVGVVLLPAVAALFLVFSVYRGRRRGSGARSARPER